MTNVLIPAGLIDNNIEIFGVDSTPMAIFEGQTIPFWKLPTSVIELIYDDLQSQPSAVLALELSGYKTKEQKIEKYTMCQYGGFDNKADIVSGTLSENEYHDCGFRGECEMEGIVCKSIKYNGHLITPFDFKMINLLATEDTLPVISEKLKVSMNTFEIKKKLLFEKLNVLSRARLIAVAFTNNLINEKHV